MFVGHEVQRSIAEFYVKQPAAPLDMMDVMAILLIAYLFLVAVSGRWRLFWSA